MSGHSKWANIKHKKANVDAKRGKIFTKLGKELMVAAKLGGSDEHANPRLRTAIIKARGSNMPNDIIDRAVKKGAGELEGVNYEEFIYEGYGPNGTAIIMEVMTDKKSRTLPEVKNIFNKAGGQLADTGAVSYLFDLNGIIVIDKKNITEEELFDLIIEAGAEDLETEDDVFIVKTEKSSFNAVLSQVSNFVESKKSEILESGLKYIPKAMVEIKKEKEESIRNFLDKLEENDDIQNIYYNIDIEL